jgi:hypothetical protein
MIFEGIVTKLRSELASPVRYFLGGVELNDFIGRTITLSSLPEKRCIHCDRAIKKTFGQGFCFPCFRSLARCDTCIVRPELCHFHKGTCREPGWGEEHCLIDHTIYLAATTSIKIGITRSHQRETRWIDQGALSALELGRVPERLQAGLIEVELKKHFSDKTNWRDLLVGKEVALDLAAEKGRIRDMFPDLFSHHAGEYSARMEPTYIEYPVQEYLPKARSVNLDKTPEIRGELTGIRGQYLLLDGGGINVRKYQGYIWKLALA